MRFATVAHISSFSERLLGMSCDAIKIAISIVETVDAHRRGVLSSDLTTIIVHDLRRLEDDAKERGRADGIEAAAQWHEAESEKGKDAVRQLSVGAFHVLCAACIRAIGKT